MTPYQRLGVPPTATEAEIKAAYRRLAMQFHPDRNGGDPESEATFKDITNAYETLRNSGRPSDAGSAHRRASGFGTGQSRDFNDFGAERWASMDEFFGDFMRTQRRQNQDLIVDCRISLVEAFRGTDITVELPHGPVSVHIPAGVDTGTRVRVPQAGGRVYPSIRPGDLIVQITVLPHPRFIRTERDLSVEVTVPVWDIILGGTVELTGIDGHVLSVTVPKSFDPSGRLRLAGQGMPGLNGADRGHLLVGLAVEFPPLTAEQEALLRTVRSKGQAP